MIKGDFNSSIDTDQINRTLLSSKVCIYSLLSKFKVSSTTKNRFKKIEKLRQKFNSKRPKNFTTTIKPQATTSIPSISQSTKKLIQYDTSMLISNKLDPIPMYVPSKIKPKTYIDDNPHIHSRPVVKISSKKDILAKRQ